jgi:hypothetical protein
MAQHTPNPTPFAFGWYSFDLGRYRPCDGTYCLFAYESLPPLPHLDGTLSWLGPLDEDTNRQLQIYRSAPEARGKLHEVAATAATLGLTLPDAFQRLMASPELQDRIPSCTACDFRLSETIVPCPASEDGYIIRFLNDQQDVLLWYLYLTPTGEQCVLVSPFALEELHGLSADHRSAVVAQTYVCAPSFETFIYRFWLENTLWFKVSEGDGSHSLTEDERRYLAHYSQAGGANGHA